MDSFVTARVPAEIKEQGNAILKSIGSTPTELVNAAYAYVLEEKALPDYTQPQTLGGRVLTDEQRATVRSWLAETRFQIPESAWDSRSCKDIIAEGRLADYEALS